MGDAKRRKALGQMPSLVRLPPITEEELHLLHDLLHRHLHELHAPAAEGAGEDRAARLKAVEALHHKLFAH